MARLRDGALFDLAVVLFFAAIVGVVALLGSGAYHQRELEAQRREFATALEGIDAVCVLRKDERYSCVTVDGREFVAAPKEVRL